MSDKKENQYILKINGVFIKVGTMKDCTNYIEETKQKNKATIHVSITKIGIPNCGNFRKG